MHRLRTLLAAAAAVIMLATQAASLLAHDEFRFIGVITKADVAKNVITVKYKEFDGKEEVVTVKLNAKTTITRDSKPVAKTELRANVNVVVDALGCDDDFDAVAVKIVPAPKK
jgi:hypothetical protein